MPKKKSSRKKEHSLKYGRAEEHIRHILEYRGGGSHSPKKYNRKDKHRRDWTRDKDPVPFFLPSRASTRWSGAALAHSLPAGRAEDAWLPMKLHRAISEELASGCSADPRVLA